MAKQKGPASVPNRHIYSRASYLHQAAHYLATVPQQNNDEPRDNDQHSAASSATVTTQQQKKAAMNLSRQLVGDMKSVTLKTLIRQSPAMKRSVCKYCNTVQIEGQTCHSRVENASKGGKKPWADVLVIQCSTCQNVKRYPVDCPRQKRKHIREPKVAASAAEPEGPSHSHLSTEAADET